MRLSELNKKTLPMFVIMTGAAVALFLMVRAHCGLDRLLIGDVTFFMPEEMQIGREKSNSEPGTFVPAPEGMVRHPTNTNLWIIGPVGPDGRVIPRIIVDRKGLVYGEYQ